MSLSAHVHTNSLPSFIMLLISFLGGFQIMALEVCGFRVLQTNLGSSVVVTGTLLTIIMVLLSSGYYLGGRLSNIFSTILPLILILIAAVLYTHIFDTLLIDSVTSVSIHLRTMFLSSHFLRSGIPAVFLVLVLYGPPILILSTISSILIKLYTISGPKENFDAGLQSGFLCLPQQLEVLPELS
jgi:hypothetical protein